MVGCGKAFLSHLFHHWDLLLYTQCNSVIWSLIKTKTTGKCYPKKLQQMYKWPGCQMFSKLTQVKTYTTYRSPELSSLEPYYISFLVS